VADEVRHLEWRQVYVDRYLDDDRLHHVSPRAQAGFFWLLLASWNNSQERDRWRGSLVKLAGLFECEIPLAERVIHELSTAGLVRIHQNKNESKTIVIVPEIEDAKRRKSSRRRQQRRRLSRPMSRGMSRRLKIDQEQDQEPPLPPQRQGGGRRAARTPEEEKKSLEDQIAQLRDKRSLNTFQQKTLARLEDQFRALTGGPPAAGQGEGKE
jgi:hypothetical protein